MAWVARGKRKALGTKKSSTPAVVPGAAPALAKAGSADLSSLVDFPVSSEPVVGEQG